VRDEERENDEKEDEREFWKRGVEAVSFSSLSFARAFTFSKNALLFLL
jgi:hypothetical protein